MELFTVALGIIIIRKRTTLLIAKTPDVVIIVKTITVWTATIAVITAAIIAVFVAPR